MKDFKRCSVSGEKNCSPVLGEIRAGRNEGQSTEQRPESSAFCETCAF